MEVRVQIPDRGRLCRGRHEAAHGTICTPFRPFEEAVEIHYLLPGGFIVFISPLPFYLLKEDQNMAKNGARAFVNPMIPSESLARVTGGHVMPRSEAVRKIWHYIGERDLRDKADRRMVNSDETLKAIFGGKTRISMFEITGLVSGHLS